MNEHVYIQIKLYIYAIKLKFIPLLTGHEMFSFLILFQSCKEYKSHPWPIRCTKIGSSQDMASWPMVCSKV